MILIKLYSPGDDGGGGDPKKKAPPKGYKPTTPSQRRDWNDMLDKMQKDGIAGGKDLDQSDRNVGAAYIEKYIKETPGTSVSPELIPHVQYEQQQLRSGDSFAGMSPEQTRILRNQLASNYLQRQVPDPGTPFNSGMSRAYYPEFKKGGKSYGTDAEGYMKDFSTPAPIDSTGKTKEPVKENINDDTLAPKDNDRIPLPNYNDTTSRGNYLKKWVKKYGDLEGRGDTVLKVNEVPRGGSDTAKNIATKAAKKYGLDPALLYSSAMEEGMSGLFKDKSGMDTRHRKPGDFGYQDFYGDKEFSINGGQSFGFQTFADRFPELVKKGLLPESFASKFRSKDAPMNQQGSNEVREKNNFKSVEDAMQAKAAMMKYHYDDIDGYAKSKGISLSPKAREFFALVEFNAGEGTGHSMLNDYHNNGYLENDKFLEKRPTSGKGIKESSYGPVMLDGKSVSEGVYGHVARRLKMRDALKREKLFEE